MGCKDLQKNHQYYQAIDKTFKKTTIIAHAHHAKITLNKCTKDNQYAVTHMPHWGILFIFYKREAASLTLTKI